MPKLEIEPIVERLNQIEMLLQENDFSNARFLLEDLINSLKEVNEKLKNWEKELGK